jgi:hypothetical protein
MNMKNNFAFILKIFEILPRLSETMIVFIKRNKNVKYLLVYCKGK